MRKAFVVFIVSLMFCGRSFGQITDWRTFLGEPPNPDQQLQEEHRQKGVKLIDALIAADPQSLEKDVSEILKVFGDGEEARGQASGVLATVAMLRADGSEALKKAVPKLISQFQDGNRMVRENSIRAIVSLRPQIPDESLEPLISLARTGAKTATDSIYVDHFSTYRDQTSADLAVFGLARLAKTSERALDEVVDLLHSAPSVETRSAAVVTAGQLKLDHPAIIARLGEIIGEVGLHPDDSEADRELIRRAINAVAEIGPAAVSLTAQLEQAAKKEYFSTEAQSALSRLKK